MSSILQSDFSIFVADLVDPNFPEIPKPNIPIVLSFMFFGIIISYLNFKVDNPISANITAIIQNLITIVDSAQPLFSK